MLRIGILGAGHLGKIHLNLVAASPAFELIGFYDPDPAAVEKLVNDKGYKAFESAEALINAVDVVSIITPTLSHFEILILDDPSDCVTGRPISPTDPALILLCVTAKKTITSNWHALSINTDPSTLIITGGTINNLKERMKNIFM